MGDPRRAGAAAQAASPLTMRLLCDAIEPFDSDIDFGQFAAGQANAVIIFLLP
jgi:hypothetical protein